MSNTTTVSPYAEHPTSTATTGSTGADMAESFVGAGAACVVGVIAGAAALCQWLAEETPEDRAALDQAKAERRRERLARREALTIGRPADVPPAITSVELHLRDPETLVRSAERLGYRTQPLARPAEPLRSQAQILLRSAAGERMAIERTGEGRVVVHTLGKRERVQALVRQHTVDRVAEHLAEKGMAVQTARLANGEVQVIARERDTGQKGGVAEIKAQIRSDGTAWIDVDKVRGNRCELIVAQIAEAVGGEVSASAKKDSYFQLPGEPTKTRLEL